MSSQKLKVYGIAKQEKIPLIYKKIDSQTFLVCDENGERHMDKEEWMNHWKNPVSSPYIMIPTTKKRKMELPIEREEFIEQATEIKKISKGVINPFITGRPAKTAEALFYTRYNYKNGVPDDIDDCEARWLKSATVGSIIYKDTYEGEAWKYDVKSMYPSIMNSVAFLVPMKKGEEKTFTREEFQALKYFPIGIYRVDITGNINRKMFRINTEGYYTHYDLTRAKELNYQIEIMDDGYPNALLYPRKNCKTGNEIFKDFINLLYPIKEKKIGMAKTILNSLWGYLGYENNVIEMVASKENPVALGDDREIVNILPLEDGSMKVKFTIPGRKTYKTNFARMLPFLLAKGRMKITRLIEPYQDKLIRCHTDDIVVKEPINIKTGDMIGDLEYEGYCENLIITKSSQKLIGEFDIYQTENVEFKRRPKKIII